MKRIVGGSCRWGEAPRRRLLAPVLGSLLLGTAGAQLGEMRHTERVSLSSTGTPGNGDSTLPSISVDGRYVAFASYADNLVPGDTNGVEDVFVHDRTTGKTEIVSLSSRDSGAAADRDSSNPVISADGRFVAFASEASNLVDEDTNGALNIFVRDRMVGTTELVSLTSDGAPANVNYSLSAISGDGRYVAFTSFYNNVVPMDTYGQTDVFVRDRVAKTTEIMSVSSNGSFANEESCDPAISADGRYVAFCSTATNLVPGDRNDTSSHDIFVRDRVAKTTELVSLSSDNTQGNGQSLDPAISSDGRYVAFLSYADNLVPGDRNGSPDIFVRDRLTRSTVRASFVTPSDPGNGGFWGQASISADGRTVAFVYYNLAPGDTKGRWHVFVRDLSVGRTELISASDADAPGNGTSLYPAISADGSFVAFESTADNLVPGDTNGRRDIFVRDLSPRPAGLVAEPADLTFGRIAVGTTKTGTLMLRDAGTRTITGSVGALALPFRVVEGGGSFTLGPGASRGVTVAFAPMRPSDPGGFQARLAITSDDPSAPTLEVLLSGESFSASDGRLVLIPTAQQGLTLALTARELVYGECKDGSLLLQNTGAGPLMGRVESLQAPFDVVEGAGEFLLQPGESRKVIVRFCPPVGGFPRLYGTVLQITSSDLQGMSVNMPVRVPLP